MLKVQLIADTNALLRAQEITHLVVEKRTRQVHLHPFQR